MEAEVYTSGLVATNSYYVEAEGKGYLIDAPDGIGRFASSIKDRGGNISSVLLTHGHFDHVMGIEEVLEFFPEATVFLSAGDHCLLTENRRYLEYFGIPLSLYSIPQEESFIPLPDKIGPFQVIRTPGHTKGSVSFLIDGTLFSGDTLFSGGEGRTDLGGNYLELKSSLKALVEMDGNIMVLPGHGGRTTIREERRRLSFSLL
ncbi:MAG: MBL fold metallo-hydrolase [Candidatus Ornithospirochaeta sp.]